MLVAVSGQTVTYAGREVDYATGALSRVRLQLVAATVPSLSTVKLRPTDAVLALR